VALNLRPSPRPASLSSRYSVVIFYALQYSAAVGSGPSPFALLHEFSFAVADRGRKKCSTSAKNPARIWRIASRRGGRSPTSTCARPHRNPRALTIGQIAELPEATTPPFVFLPLNRTLTTNAIQSHPSAFTTSDSRPESTDMEFDDGALAPVTGVKKSAKIWWTMTDEVGPSPPPLAIPYPSCPLRSCCHRPRSVRRRRAARAPDPRRPQPFSPLPLESVLFLLLLHSFPWHRLPSQQTHFEPSCS